MNTALLLQTAVSIVQMPTFLLHVHPGSVLPHIPYVNAGWTQTFRDANNIVVHAQSVKLILSPRKQEMINRDVAYYLGQMKQDYDVGALSEEFLFNADEMHFKIDTHDFRKLAMRVGEEVKFSGLVSGGDGMTVMLILGGCPDARITTPMLVFQNACRNYRIRGTPDTVACVCYRTHPKGWMDGKVFVEWIT